MKKTALPVAVIIAGIIIAGAVIITSDNATPTSNNADTKKPAKTEIALREISKDDHILGNPNAKLIIVEYSDTECPFCKHFHPTMKKVMEEYGKSGKVAWVYRHFPLDVLHSKARKEAEATECATELGGNAKFWEYLDRLFEITPSNDGLNLEELPKIAEFVGLDATAFNKCLDSGKYADKVEADFQDARSAGGTGTPYSVIVSKDGTKTPVNGALPYPQMKQIIDGLLK